MPKRKENPVDEKKAVKKPKVTAPAIKEVILKSFETHMKLSGKNMKLAKELMNHDWTLHGPICWNISDDVIKDLKKPSDYIAYYFGCSYHSHYGSYELQVLLNVMFCARTQWRMNEIFVCGVLKTIHQRMVRSSPVHKRSAKLRRWMEVVAFILYGRISTCFNPIGEKELRYHTFGEYENKLTFTPRITNCLDSLFHK